MRQRENRKWFISCKIQSFKARRMSIKNPIRIDWARLGELGGWKIGFFVEQAMLAARTECSYTRDDVKCTTEIAEIHAGSLTPSVRTETSAHAGRITLGIHGRIVCPMGNIYEYAECKRFPYSGLW